MKDRLERKARSVVYCPECRHRTYTTVSYGEVGIHCKFCGHDFEVVIRAQKAHSKCNSKED